MAKRKSSTKTSSPGRCPTTLKPNAKTPGTCFRAERVQRDKKKGYITSFYSKSTGRFVGYSSPAGACRLTRDPFQASIRPQGEASKVGSKCAEANFGRKK